MTLTVSAWAHTVGERCRLLRVLHVVRKVRKVVGPANVRPPNSVVSMVLIVTNSGRKIGCDKTLPECLNCLRTKRHCEGYGLKLAWPDEDGDGRRPDSVTCPSSNTPHFILPASNGRYLYFLNTSRDDLLNNTRRLLPSSANARFHAPQIMHEFAMRPPFALKFGHESVLNKHESLLLSYCK